MLVALVGYAVAQAERVITAMEIARLTADGRLVLDLRRGSYRIDPSAGPVDVTRIDLLNATGAIVPMESLLDRDIDAGKISRDKLKGELLVEAELSGSEITLAAAALNGLELFEEFSGQHSTWWRSPKAYCSGTKTLVGMGSTQPNDGSILFRGLIPAQGAAPNPIGAESAAQEDLTGTMADWKMTAYAICSIPLAGLEVAESGSSYDTTSTRTWSVSCPSGKKVIGAGGTIWQGEGRVKIDEIRPNESLDQVTVTASEDQDGTSSGWSLRAYAVCAYPIPGLVRVSKVAANGWDERNVDATCPSEKRLLSVGGGVAASDPIAMRVFDLRPSQGLTVATVRVTTKGSTSGVTGEVRSYAICADG
jgi:hypothetical protein